VVPLFDYNTLEKNKKYILTQIKFKILEIKRTAVNKTSTLSYTNA